MLVSLHVKNLALIDETEVNFGEGLNILSGETGAGKSIIIGSIQLALGEKANGNLIRKGKEYGLVELVFQIDHENQREKMKELDIAVEEDDLVIIQRKIMPVRSVAKVNGELVGKRQLKELASVFINIHGQHETQSLLNVKKYSEILDDYAWDDLADIKDKLKIQYKEYLALSEELENNTLDEATKLREISLARFEIDEIEQMKLVVGEDEELEQQYRKMSYAKKIVESLSNAHLYTGYEGENGAGSQIGRALREVKSVLSYDDEVTELDLQLTDIDNLLNDFNRNLSTYLTELEFEKDDFEMVENRLNQINHAKDKYGRTIEDILAYQAKQREQLEKLMDYESYIEDCKRKLRLVKDDISKESEKASEVRIRYAEKLSLLLAEALRDLNFIDVDFQIDVMPNPAVISPNGYDEVGFMISTNPGEPRKSLNSVASGGELSRIMLALKTVMADKEQIPTLIFDEIDAGISGMTAWKVSEKMAVIGKSHQVICITHLPQIAAMADSHFLIEKSSDQVSTKTEIAEIVGDDLLKELARLLGGNGITETVLANAKEMKELATKTKQI